MLQYPIIEMLRPSRLEERDRKRFGEWRNKRVITMLRLGLVVGAAMTTLVHFADRLIDVEIASQVLPYRLSVAGSWSCFSEASPISVSYGTIPTPWSSGWRLFSVFPAPPSRRGCPITPGS